ncbi:antibiotic biosynthesis monooxygenase [Gemmata sp. JC673]|uniref:Antibiotic biosynthesis monooxygenase n=1 Tax=Gemmata algarum TaxID=2975278 RepID=A0ABU5F1Y9_9BACT|nr:putative quinol monooxygenase [Gemmata algarum]MDY3561199.1 antibiotic biosynthesis monooxygenase [Gemmata algarum]
MLRALMFAAPLTLLLTAGTRTNAADEELPIVKMLKSKLKDEKKTFAILVTFKVKAGNEKKFEEAFVPCLAATRKEAGCVAYVLNRDTEDPTTYIMYESFKGIPGIEAHMKEKHTQTLLATVVPMCDGEPKIKVLTVPE